MEKDDFNILIVDDEINIREKKKLRYLIAKK